jgi:hypothetical protein
VKHLLHTLPERLTLAHHDQLDYAAFLQMLLADEVSRRDNRNMVVQLRQAGFEEICRLEDFNWTTSITQIATYTIPLTLSLIW